MGGIKVTFSTWVSAVFGRRAQVDFEAELAIVLGKALKNSGASEALEAVLGVTGANDISARRWGKGERLSLEI